jgi:hypothetical protein
MHLLAGGLGAGLTDRMRRSDGSQGDNAASSWRQSARAILAPRSPSEAASSGGKMAASVAGGARRNRRASASTASSRIVACLHRASTQSNGMLL